LSTLDLPGLGQNMFVDLMQRIIEELNISNSWICGGALMTEEWPWRGESLEVLEILEWNHTEITESHPEGWILPTEVVAKESIHRTG
ncbi:ENR1 protein, partial [Probosciger aterrimus]|nr:ENR1 protein [Probosciger aterrimus]